MIGTASAQQDSPAGIVGVEAWIYECVVPGRHDKFYHVYLAELAGGEARIALHWGRNRTNGQRPKTEHHRTVEAARRRVDEIRAEREDHNYTLLDAGPIELDARVVGLLGLTGVIAAGATNPFERHAALAQRCLRLLTGDVSSEHLQVMRDLRTLVGVIEEAAAEVRSRQEMLEIRFRRVLMDQ